MLILFFKTMQTIIPLKNAGIKKILKIDNKLGHEI